MFEKVFELIKSFFNKFSRSFLIFVILLFSVSLLRSVNRVRQVGTGIQEAQERVDKLKKESQELEKELEIVKSDNFIEKQMRDKLGLAKEGEIVLILPDEAVLKKLTPNYSEEEEVLPDPNWKKWARLFFYK